jgi:hypothetical protein
MCKNEKELSKFTHKRVMLPPIAFNASQNDKRFVDIAVPLGIDRRRRVSSNDKTWHTAVLGTNDVVCGGACSIIDPVDNSTYCACHDGITTSMFTEARTRNKHWDVFKAILKLCNAGQKALCSMTPPPKCRFCGVGFDPEDPLS